MKSVEAQLHEAFERIGQLTGENIELKKVIHEKQITIAKIERDGVLKVANLSPDSVDRLHKAFATSTNNAGLKEAINVERKRAQ